MTKRRVCYSGFFFINLNLVPLLLIVPILILVPVLVVPFFVVVPILVLVPIFLVPVLFFDRIILILGSEQNQLVLYHIDAEASIQQARHCGFSLPGVGKSKTFAGAKRVTGADGAQGTWYPGPVKSDICQQANGHRLIRQEVVQPAFREAFLRSLCLRCRLRRRMAAGVISTSSSSAMNSRAPSSVRSRGGSSRMASSAPAARML